MPLHVSWPLWDARDYLNNHIADLERKFAANPKAVGLRDMAARMRNDLPTGPRPLTFLGQLFLNEIAAAALPGWPASGSLAFFFAQSPSAWGFDPMSKGHAQVLYFPAGEELVPCQFPADLADELRFPERKVRFEEEWTLPTSLEIGDTYLSIYDTPDYRALCNTLQSESSDDAPIHRCAGHPQEIQRAMQLECQLVTHGIFCGDASGYKDPRRAELEPGTADWELLLQLDSDEKNLNWMWADMGRIYFWVRRQDIEVREFQKGWAILQSF